MSLSPGDLSGRNDFDSDSKDLVISLKTLIAVTDVPLFIGFILSSILLGIMFLQTFIYFMSFPADRKAFKWLVGTMFFLECASSTLAVVSGVASLLDNSQLLCERYMWAIQALGPICGVVAFLAHGFYAWRIYVFINSIWLPMLICLVSIMQAVMVSLSAVKFYLEVGVLTLDDPEFVFINVLWLGGGAFVDILIAATFTVIFTRRAKTLDLNSRGGMKNTISRIMVLCIDTAAITAFGALLELALFLVFRNTFIHFALFYVLPRLYANCMLAMLNARILLAPAPASLQPYNNSYTIKPFSMEEKYSLDEKRKTVFPPPGPSYLDLINPPDHEWKAGRVEINNRPRYTASLRSLRSNRKSLPTHFELVRGFSERKKVPSDVMLGTFDWEEPKSPEMAMYLVV